VTIWPGMEGSDPPPGPVHESSVRSAGGVDAMSFRRAVGRFATGVTVVTTLHADGNDVALTANTFTSVSLEPLLVLVSVQRSSRLHGAVLSSGQWGISVLSEHQEAQSRYFASASRHETPDQFDGVPVRRGPVTGCALLAEACAVFECRTAATYPGGDHLLVLGEVLSLDMPHPEARPLLFLDGHYRSIAVEQPAPPRAY